MKSMLYVVFFIAPYIGMSAVCKTNLVRADDFVFTYDTVQLNGSIGEKSAKTHS